jgi:hypothetical protein
VVFSFANGYHAHKGENTVFFILYAFVFVVYSMSENPFPLGTAEPERKK